MPSYNDYDHDMMPTEVAAGDLSPGDMVDGAPILRWLADHGHEVEDGDTIQAEHELWHVERAWRETSALTGEPIAVLYTTGTNVAVPADLPVTAHGAICECGVHPLDCECEG